MDEAIGTPGMIARWRCAKCAVILLNERGSAAGLKLAQRDSLVRRPLGPPRADVTYCVCNECGMEWLYEGASPSREENDEKRERVA